MNGSGYREIAQWFRDAIAVGDLKPGASLPSEAQVSAQWSVSRVTARRALTTLETEGLVDTAQGRGRRVRPSGHEAAAEGSSQAARIAAELRHAITSGTLEPAGQLDTETVLGQRYGVAPGTAREALLMLDREGLTIAIQGRGRFVAAPGTPTIKRSDDVAQKLRQQIRSGDLAVGVEIPGELELAAKYAVGRGTVRRALELLEQDGWLTRSLGRRRSVSAILPADVER